MRKSVILMLAAASVTLTAFPTYAGSWKYDGKNWSYDIYDDGYFANDEWMQIDGEWYHFDSYANMQTGWIKDGNHWYFLANNGVMKKNTWIGDYYLGETGAMLTSSRTPDGYYVGEDGKWIPEFARSYKAHDLYQFTGHYTHASGAGAWSVELDVNADGSFTGVWGDTDMIDGIGYDATHIGSTFHGRFGSIYDAGDKHTARVDELWIEGNEGDTKIVDRIKTITTKPAVLNLGDEIVFYGKGNSTKNLPEGFLSWYITGNLTEKQTLPINGFYNVTTDSGFFQYE